MKPVLVGLSAVLAVSLSFIAYSRIGNATAGEAPPQTVNQSSWKAPNHLVFSGANGNFPRIATWLFQGVAAQFPRQQFTGEILFTGTSTGYGDVVKDIERGYAQLGVTIPAATLYMAQKGIGMFSKPHPNLRGLFRIRRRSFITFAIRADLGVTSMDELIQRRIPLKLATGNQGGDNTWSYVCNEILKGYGLSLAEVKQRGGEFVEMASSGYLLPTLMQGKANASCTQSTTIEGSGWKELNAKIPMRMLSIRQDVIDKLAPLGFRKFDHVFKKGSYPSVLDDVTTVAFEDWIVFGDTSISDDLAYKIAKAAVDGIPAWLNQGYAAESHPEGEDKIGLVTPTPRNMWQDLGVPLHPGAAKYFKEMGYMP